MNNLNQYIIEKLKLNKDIKTEKYTFKEVEDTEPFWGYNWILSNAYFDTCYPFLNYALDHCILTPNEEDFINDFIKDIEEYYSKYKNNDKYKTKQTEIINGKINNGYYQRSKCIYDIAKYLHENHVKGLKDKFGDNVDEDIENVLVEIDRLTDHKINKLDWPH